MRNNEPKTRETQILHNDEPTLLDNLDRRLLIEEVGEAVACCTPPQVFGIHGDWGLGKTSFLHQVQWYLTGDCPQQLEKAMEEAMEEANKAVQEAKKAMEEAKKATQDAMEKEYKAMESVMDNATKVVMMALMQKTTQDAMEEEYKAKAMEDAMEDAMKASRMVEEAMKKKGVHKDKVRTVWFDAWQYQNEPVPVVALLHEMRAQLSWQRPVARRMKAAFRGVLLSMEEVTKTIGLQYSKLEQANLESKIENLAVPLPSHTLREYLQEAIGHLLPKPKNKSTSPRLVVFIDDIDRCEPEAAYRLLEGLKIYLNLNNCVFVLGMNQKVIEEAIGQRMRDKSDDNPPMRAAAYMEKLCQNVWRLPAVRKPGKMLHDLLTKTEIVRSLNSFGWIEEENMKMKVKGIEKKALNKIYLPPNPRRLKGLANLLNRMSSRLPHQSDKPEDLEENEKTDLKGALEYETKLLVTVAYIYHFHHDLYIRWEADPTLYGKILDWCAGDQKGLSHKFFERLELPFAIPLKSLDATGIKEAEFLLEEQFETRFLDPTDVNIFWIQSLILHIGQKADSDHFKRYLHGVSA